MTPEAYHPDPLSNDLFNEYTHDASFADFVPVGEPKMPEFPPAFLHQQGEMEKTTEHKSTERASQKVSPSAPQSYSNSADDINKKHKADKKTQYTDDLGDCDMDGMDDFDPAEEVARLDVENELVRQWEELQAEMDDKLCEFTTTVLTNAYTIAHKVANTLYVLNEETRAQLEDGVQAIRAEEDKHEEHARRIRLFMTHLRAATNALTDTGDV